MVSGGHGHLGLDVQKLAEMVLEESCANAVNQNLPMEVKYALALKAKLEGAL